MTRFYFDMHEGDEIASDEAGMELATFQAVQEEAARSLADMARDAVRKLYNGEGHRMSIDVRDDEGPVLQVKFTFEINRHRR